MKAKSAERRKYVRIATVLPVEFYIADSQQQQITPWLQGFTHDVSKGGIRLVVNDIWKGFWEKVVTSGAVLSLRITLHFRQKPISATAKVVWADVEKQSDFNRHTIGLEFTKVHSREADLLFRYALTKKVVPLLVGGIVGFLAIAMTAVLLNSHVLTRQNKKLVNDYVALLQQTNVLEKELQEVQAKGVSAAEVKEKIDILIRQKQKVSTKVIDGMYDWIKYRQDLIKGLVLSYEGDDRLQRVCFTYDQALAAIVFMVRGDTERAKKILDFYYERINEKSPVHNAYFTDGSVFEYVIHCGPNAWIGLAALDYVRRTGERRYLAIAENIAAVLSSNMDKEGGVRGGPDETWYSTEHNLDAYAFFMLLYEVTGDESSQESAGKIKRWLKRYAYTQYGPPVKRGKGDATIATDTYAWSVAALSPKTLRELGMNPETIIEYAIEKCGVKTEFKRTQGSVSISGFDFSKAKHLARGGVISGEWTAQMILTLEIMADYFKEINDKKSKDYFQKAKFYFNELQKMLITSFSRVGREDPCLPYASHPLVDTGHGWRTPKGDKTGSLASTAYFLLAYEGYNPLRAERLGLSFKKEDLQAAGIGSGGKNE